MNRLTLRDSDHRVADSPYALTGTVDDIVAYLAGPLRADLTSDADASIIHDAIIAVRAGDLPRANAELRPLLVTIEVAT